MIFEGDKIVSRKHVPGRKISFQMRANQAQQLQWILEWIRSMNICLQPKAKTAIQKTIEQLKTALRLETGPAEPLEDYRRMQASRIKLPKDTSKAIEILEKIVALFEDNPETAPSKPDLPKHRNCRKELGLKSTPSKKKTRAPKKQP